MATGRHLLSARASFVAENIEGGDEEFRPSASAGVSYVKCEECGDGRIASSVGLAVSVEARLWPTTFAGIGLHGFGNVNPIASFGGVAVTIHVGRLRWHPAPAAGIVALSDRATLVETFVKLAP